MKTNECQKTQKMTSKKNSQLLQVSFRLAVLETARGRIRASSYGFKASLWFKSHLPTC